MTTAVKTTSIRFIARRVTLVAIAFAVGASPLNTTVAQSRPSAVASVADIADEIAPTAQPTQTVTADGATATPTAAVITGTSNITATPTPAPTVASIQVTSTQTPTAVLTTTIAVSGGVTAIGDSVMLGAARELRKAIKDVKVDAKVSRSVPAAIRLVNGLRGAGKLGQVVVLHVGNNGPITAKQFDALMASLADTKLIVLLNLKVARRWEAPNNAVITNGAMRYPNVVLVDWKSVSSRHPEFFARDGIHLGAKGARLYTELVVNMLRSSRQTVPITPPPSAISVTPVE